MKDHIPEEQRTHAAMYFSITNIGQPPPDSLCDIEEAYYALLDELRDGAEEFEQEFRHWKDKAEHSDPHVVRRWNEEIYPFLFTDDMWRIKER